jgi:hypothetical protein
VSYDDSTEPEVDLEVDEDGMVTGTARIVLTCAECGTELKEANFDAEVDLSDWAEKHQGEKHSLEVEASNSEMTQRSQTHDRHGRKIKLARYMRSYYGVSVQAQVKCSCGEETEGTFEDEVMASGMDEMV